jgi:hypothetical protein
VSYRLKRLWSVMARAFFMEGQMEFVFNEYSDTIRIMPENYCAVMRHGHLWHAEVDMAVDEQRAVDIFQEIRKHHLVDGPTLAKLLNIRFGLEVNLDE